MAPAVTGPAVNESRPSAANNSEAPSCGHSPRSGLRRMTGGFFRVFAFHPERPSPSVRAGRARPNTLPITKRNPIMRWSEPSGTRQSHVTVNTVFLMVAPSNGQHFQYWRAPEALLSAIALAKRRERGPYSLTRPVSAGTIRVGIRSTLELMNQASLGLKHSIRRLRWFARC